MVIVATMSDGVVGADEDDEYGDKPIVCVYDLHTADLKNVFVEPADGIGSGGQRRQRRRFVCVRFLFDNMFASVFVTNTDGCGGALYYYSWRNSIIDTCVRIDGHVNEVRTRMAMMAPDGGGGEGAGAVDSVRCF